MRKFLILLAFLPIFSTAQNVDSTFINALSNDIFNNGKAYDWLYHLTKKIGNRLSGSQAFNKAVAWGNITMKQAGATNVWLQECTIPYWVRGGKDIVNVVEVNGKKQNISLNTLALGNSIGTGLKGITTTVMAFNNFTEFELKKNQVKGKIVFFNYPFNNSFVETFKAYGDAGKYRRTGAILAAKNGAVGLVIRSMSHATDNNPHTGGMQYNDSFPKIPAFALGLKDADKLYEFAKDKEVKLFIKSQGKFLPDTIGHNVIGELIGSEFPNEFITIGGHLDSWDIAEGAHDDGAGCVQTMEVLRAFTALGYKPRHSIRFVLFANEENGLNGGNKYASEAKIKNEKHIFALESDAGGFTPRGFGFTASEQQLKKMQDWLTLLQPYGTQFLKMGGGGADIGPLNKEFKTPLAGLSPDSQRYFDIHHAASDVFENVNKRELHLGAINMAALIYLVDKYGL